MRMSGEKCFECQGSRSCRTSMTELMADPSNTLAFADLGISSAAPLPLSLPLPVPQPVEAAASTNGGRGAGGRWCISKYSPYITEGDFSM